MMRNFALSLDEKSKENYYKYLDHEEIAIYYHEICAYLSRKSSKELYSIKML